MKEIKIGGRYMHFKGHVVKVICFARHTENEEEMVVYEEESDSNPKGKYWVRPKKMFLEKVKREGKEVQRFTYIPSN